MRLLYCNTCGTRYDGLLIDSRYCPSHRRAPRRHVTHELLGCETRCALIHAALAAGWKHVDIAHEVGVTRARIGQIIYRHSWGAP